MLQRAQDLDLADGSDRETFLLSVHADFLQRHLIFIFLIMPLEHLTIGTLADLQRMRELSGIEGFQQDFKILLADSPAAQR